ncbi:hypothetical protein [Erwinia amylovora]|uniref:Uncharacterized protein n=4 Tax=Erwinia amylovora TaxID=552 RepID=A0A831ET30_ERWAM|nr:hypothetical protein [Erwinia amylovora]CBX81282.1 hypothetical protein predicted by Glimmer/Critica [Erwinia amylovora ATCC BAA-2158]CDK15815.1 hypothetical protein LA635_2191 [Erwinia amylovora LA635]CDK19181.1 hypothetical protein LA636_2189 [Erwinia amylovora LA636]CDK22552.1 hypothetical protein LA637_2192 [Erwinia amylovora LA637]EKV53415.1 hypothetical protein EaACW_2419 [Erwinia amylovora ACW56400]
MLMTRRAGYDDGLQGKFGQQENPDATTSKDVPMRYPPIARSLTGAGLCASPFP